MEQGHVHSPTCGCAESTILNDLRARDCVIVTVQSPWRGRLLTETVYVAEEVIGDVRLADVVYRRRDRAEDERQHAINAAWKPTSPDELMRILTTPASGEDTSG